jgi:predicted pyridoxine 5'-phosphate oxidase superfamily flavin-nucleotide-binding protein
MSRDLADLARSIIDANLYLTLGTADRDGPPWVSPVHFGTAEVHRLLLHQRQRNGKGRRGGDDRRERLDLAAAGSGRRGVSWRVGRRLGLLFRHRRTLHAQLLAGRLSGGQY